MNAMSKPSLEPDALDGGTSARLRGDPIAGDRYWSREFMQREWDHMWTRVWHIGGRLAELPQPGDYVVHDFRRESVLLVRQEDGGVRAFYNVCQHRGNKLVWNDGGSVGAFTCAYHGWRYRLTGTLCYARDPENFAKGDPSGKIALKELPCDTWGGFVWYSMDPRAAPLAAYLDPIPRLLKNRDVDKMTRVIWRRIKVDTNWKFASDNFNESYHLPDVHPSMGIYVVEHYTGHQFEIYPSGHNRVVELGHPSARPIVSDLWVNTLKAWDLDPAAFEGRPAESRLALQRARRTLGPSRGHHYMTKLEDHELTDYFHHTLFPNVTITATPNDGAVHIFRTEPDANDPEKCTFEYMMLAPAIEGVDSVATVAGMRPLREAIPEELTFGVDTVGDFVDEDLSVAVHQQKGLHSRGYTDAHLTEQESRVRRFHEVLNDYLDGRR